MIARAAPRAFLLAMVISLVTDALLAALTSGLRVAQASAGAPWWVDGHLVARSRWVVLAVLLVIVGRRLTPTAATAPGRGGAVWRFVGAAVIAIPILWIAAAWIVQATVFTVAGRWDIDGRLFISPEYYRRLLVAYVPWLAGGVAAIAMSRHVR